MNKYNKAGNHFIKACTSSIIFVIFSCFLKNIVLSTGIIYLNTMYNTEGIFKIIFRSIPSGLVLFITILLITGSVISAISAIYSSIIVFYYLFLHNDNKEDHMVVKINEQDGFINESYIIYKDGTKLPIKIEMINIDMQKDNKQEAKQ